MFETRLYYYQTFLIVNLFIIKIFLYPNILAINMVCLDDFGDVDLMFAFNLFHIKNNWL